VTQPILQGVTGGWTGWTIAYPVFAKIDGAAGQWRHTEVLLARPVLDSHLRPCIGI
jgi:hypothetical protein